MMQGLTVIFALIFLVPGISWGGAATATVDRTVASSDEAVTLTVAVSGEGGDVDISGIRDFRVMSQGTSSSVQIINGKMSRQTTYSYALLPLKKGRLVIPPLPVNQAGKTHYTGKIVVTVNDAPAQEKGERDLFVESAVSDTSPYAGQPIAYTFRLFRAVQIANANLQKPDFKDFTSQELEDRKTYRKIINGREYVVTEINDILIPLSAGSFSIGPAILKCDLVRRASRSRRSPLDSFFNDSFFGQNRLEPRIYRSKPITINVKPLPADSGTPTFSGLVGRFTIESSIEQAELKVGDSSTLEVEIAGNGNLMDAEAPEVNIPDGFKIYSDAPEDNIRLDERGYTGSRTMRYALVPVQAGDFTIPPVRLKYFDVESGTYQTVETKSVSLHVSPAAEEDQLAIFRPGQNQPQQLGLSGKKVEFTGHDILPVKETLDVLESEIQLSEGGFAILLAAPAACYLLLMLVLRMVNRRENISSKMAKRSRFFLKAASQGEAAGEDYYSSLHKALIFAVRSKAKLAGESLTYAEMRQLLLQCGIGEEKAGEVEKLLKQIEGVRFGGIDQQLNREMLEKTERIVRELTR